MANITLTGLLRDPATGLSVGDEIRFTHASTTGETVKGAISIVTIPPDGTYSVLLQYGLVLVEYKDVLSTQFKNLGVATVNATNTATSIPELLNALVPVSSAELIEFQAILADAVTAKNAAEAAAATTATRVDTFANLILLSPTTDGSTFVCQERASAEYILQAAGYTALAGDATFANGRVAKLVVKDSVSPEMFGATGSSANELTIMQSVMDYSVANNVAVEGSKAYTINGELTLNSGLTMRGNGNFELLECTVKAQGSISNETALTVLGVSGETQLTVASTTGYAVGDTIRIISCINAQAPTAGRFLLGDRRTATDITYLSEFLKIRSLTSTVIKLQSPLLFDYSLTPDADSGTRTQTSVYKANLVKDLSIKDLRVQRTTTTTNDHPFIAEYLGTNCDFNNVKFDCSAASYVYARAMELTFCYDFDLTYCDFLGIVSDSLTSSEGNTIIRACQDVTGVRCYQSGGNQGIDITHGGSSTTFGGPSIHIKLHFCEFENTTLDGVTTHWGSYENEIYKCTINTQSDRGVRVRSRGDKVIGCNINKSKPSSLASTTGIGVYVTGIPWFETEVYDNTISGYDSGVLVDANLTADYGINDLSFVEFGPSIKRNNISYCDKAVYTYSTAATARRIGTFSTDNKISFCGDGLRLGSYANNCTSKDNIYYKCENGVYIEKDNIGNIIEQEQFISCTSRSLRGSTSASNQVLDTATFGALANAGFSIKNNYYIDSPAPASMSTNLTGLTTSDFTN
jgi:hypothetical protein